MSKGVKIILYIMTGLLSFVLFLYFTFPFEILKDRILADVEKSLKGKYEIKVDAVSPKLLVGVSLKNVRIMQKNETGLTSVWEAERVKLKASLISLIVGSPKLKFDIRSGKGRITGRANISGTKTLLDMQLEDIDLAKMPIIAAKTGLSLKSSIDGSVMLDLDPRQIIRSSGKITIKPNGIKILKSTMKAGAMGEIELPPMTIGAGASVISAELKRGAIKVDAIKFEKGDLNIDLKGSIYLSTSLSNFRLNLKGDFDFTEQVGQALPFLFIVEKQKNEQGKYPLTIAGRLAKPQIKIGDFTVPL